MKIRMRVHLSGVSEETTMHPGREYEVPEAVAERYYDHGIADILDASWETRARRGTDEERAERGESPEFRVPSPERDAGDDADADEPRCEGEAVDTRPHGPVAGRTADDVGLCQECLDALVVDEAAAGATVNEAPATVNAEPPIVTAENATASESPAGMSTENAAPATPKTAKPRTASAAAKPRTRKATK